MKNKDVCVSWLGKTFWTILLIFLFTGCGVNKVVRSDNALTDKRGASYYLPRTVIVASVPIKKTTKTHAEFAYFAFPLLGISADTKEGVSYALAKGATLAISAERDPGQKFVAIYPKGPFKTSTQSVTLNPDGILSSGNATVENKSVAFAVSAVEAASKIVLANKNRVAFHEAFPEGRVTEKWMTDLLKHLNAKDDEAGVPELTLPGLKYGWTLLVDPIVGAGAAEPKVAEEGEENWNDFRTKRLKGYRHMQRAIELYRKLLSIRKKLEESKTGKDYLVFEEKQKAILAQFISSQKDEKTWSAQLRWVPPSRSRRDFGGMGSATQILFTLYSGTGPVWGGKGGFPELSMPLGFAKDAAKRKGNKTTVKIVCSSAVPQEARFWDQDEQHNPQKCKARGWHYRIPAKGTTRLMFNGRTVAKKATYIAQQGCVAFVPATSASQKIVSNVELDPSSGALVKVTHGGEAFDSALVTRAGTVASDQITARNERRKAAAEAADPVTLLEREKKILQLNEDIRKLKAAQPQPQAEE